MPHVDAGSVPSTEENRNRSSLPKVGFHQELREVSVIGGPFLYQVGTDEGLPLWHT